MTNENKVYIVCERIDYEGDNILKVFSTLEKAKEKVNNMLTEEELTPKIINTKRTILYKLDGRSYVIYTSVVK